MRSIPRGTRWLLGLFVIGSIANALFSRWMGLDHLAEAVPLVGAEVARGQLWRLVSYPWFTGDPLSLLFGAMMLYFFAAPLERTWGTQRFLVRTALLTVVPAVVTTLIGLVFGRVAVQPYVGLATLGVAYITAFASQMRDARVMMFPLPLQLTGDQLLMFEGGMLALWVLFGGLTPFIPELAGFAMGLAWFRFDVTRTLRRSWLRHRQSRLEAQVGRLRRDRKLRVVRDDDGDDERYLH